MQELAELLNQSITEINNANDLQILDSIRIKCLGKKGFITTYLKDLKFLPLEQRSQVGQELNQAKNKLTSAISDRKQSLEEEAIQQQLKAQSIDITLPARQTGIGSLHPVTKVTDILIELFKSMGYKIIIDGPEVENEYYNFEALNIPDYHPARAMHDTFYFADRTLLRTHTSQMQIRIMEQAKPPIKLIVPGRVYRADSDVRHTPMFHQLEGLVVDENVTFGDLKGTLNQIVSAFFEEDLRTRFRPSYFPFTEPSAEVDMQCIFCKGKGCNVCSHSGWIEISGCGVVHPKVLENCNIDSEQYVGFAFALGLDRMAMLKYGIPDLRMLFENDIRFLEQF